VDEDMSELSSTIDARSAASRSWSAIIIGAGPAGAATAIGLAREGLNVLLVDRKAFPREKVCGCCLSHDAVQLLRALELPDPFLSNSRGVVNTVTIASPRAIARLARARGLAISRRNLDAALVSTAMEAGAHFLAPASAQVDRAERDHRLVQLRSTDGEATIRSSIAIVADGVGGSSLRGLRQFEPRIAKNSHIGISAMSGSTGLPLDRSCIAMHCAAAGYVGAVRLEDDRINLAGAIDPRFMRKAGGPGPAARSVIRSAIGLDDPALAELRWCGTGRLTHTRRMIAGKRLYVLGDAAGYVEPFTGEGIAWALQSARDLIPIAADAARAWRASHEGEWSRIRESRLRAAHRRCFLLTRALRNETALRWSLRAIDRSSWIARAISAWLTAHGTDRDLITEGAA